MYNMIYIEIHFKFKIKIMLKFLECVRWLSRKSDQDSNKFAKRSVSCPQKVSE